MLKQQILIVVVLGLLFTSVVEGNARVHKEKPIHTRALNIENEYTKWIRWMGTLSHSLYKPAKNKLLPSSYLVVDPIDGVGDFTSAQEAIDSLPLFNIFRVVIKINAGVYE